jgi:PncC family amidohydrolase
MRESTLGVVKEVHRLFKERGLTLSIAESCTGGLISHYITSLPGASNFFIASVVSYSEDAKKDILSISAETIRRYGVVSNEIAQEMAEKMRLLIGTDYALSTTGNLGPEVLENKEKGLIYIAVNKREGTISQELRLKGDRESNKEEASLLALKLLIEFVKRGEGDGKDS